jgi:hypothetical protein
MTRHLASTRAFPLSYSQVHPHVTVSDSFPGRPCRGGELVMVPLPVGADGQPFLGMDPSAPATWVRPYNPQPGMIARLNFDGARQQYDTPMGGTWRNPMRDRADVPKRRRWRRR